ncbi:MAG: hypothetical protein IRZ21_02610 [Thermoleophilaceae bacterium]|nr:hypothetical protein [Thermoleophilaceae bacterium]
MSNAHLHAHHHEQGAHSHGLVEPSIKRSRGDPRGDAVAGRARRRRGAAGRSAVVALGFDLADPLIGLGITLVIPRITWDTWRTVRGAGRERSR